MKLTNDGFTLIEVAMSIAILSFGLTAILIVYLTSLRWAEDIRIDLTSVHTARTALFDAALLLDETGVPAGHDNKDATASGYLNDYYIVRTVTDVTLPAGLSTVGDYQEIEVKVFYGGDENSGRLVQTINHEQLLHSSYNP